MNAAPVQVGQVSVPVRCPYCARRQPVNVPRGTPITGRCEACKRCYQVTL